MWGFGCAEVERSSRSVVEPYAVNGSFVVLRACDVGEVEVADGVLKVS